MRHPYLISELSRNISSVLLLTSCLHLLQLGCVYRYQVKEESFIPVQLKLLKINLLIALNATLAFIVLFT